MPIPIIIAVTVRIAGYVWMLFFPFAGILLSFLFDFLDCAPFYFLHLPVSYYEAVDKPIDLLQYLFLIPIAKRTPVFKTFLFFLAIRLFGQILYFSTGVREVFIFFPNFVEYSLLIYLIFEYFKGKSATNRFIKYFHQKKWNDKTLWLLLFFLKLIQEVSLHFGPSADDRTYMFWASIGTLLNLQ